MLLELVCLEIEGLRDTVQPTRTSTVIPEFPGSSPVYILASKPTSRDAASSGGSETMPPFDDLPSRLWPSWTRRPHPGAVAYRPLRTLAQVIRPCATVT